MVKEKEVIHKQALLRIGRNRTTRLSKQQESSGPETSAVDQPLHFGSDSSWQFAVPPQSGPRQVCRLNTGQPREHHPELHRYSRLVYLLQQISGIYQQSILTKVCIVLIHTKMPYGRVGTLITLLSEAGRWH